MESGLEDSGQLQQSYNQLEGRFKQLQGKKRGRKCTGTGKHVQGNLLVRVVQIRLGYCSREPELLNVGSCSLSPPGGA